MRTSKVTIIVPAYNAEAYIGDCLDSILAQTFKDFVCFVYDDGSTDRTVQVAKSFERDKRVRVISDGVNKKTPRRVCEAYSKVSTEFFCQVDADDMISSEALELTVAALAGCPEQVGVVYSDYSKINKQGQQEPDDSHFKGRCRTVFSLRRMQRSGFCAFQFRLIRTSAYKLGRGVDPDLLTGEDYDLVLNLSEVCQFVHIPKKLYLYRQHDTQTSKKNPARLDFVCKGLMESSSKRKANPDLVVSFPYTGVDDLYALRRWASLATPKSILIAVAAEDRSDVDILECQEYTQHRMEILDINSDYSRAARLMVRGAKSANFQESLIPVGDVFEDLLSGKSIPIYTLEPRTSWLLVSSLVPCDIMMSNYASESPEMFGDGVPGNSALFRLTREGIYEDTKQ